MEMKMATPNDYGMMWMSPTHMLLPQGQTQNHSLPSDMLQLDPASVQLENPYYPMAIHPSFESTSEQPMEIEGFLMMQDCEPSFCDAPPKYMTAATQTSNRNHRKVKTIKHPLLKLQTPIAYKCDTDPEVIPIEKDGMAVCEKCGAIGVKHAFYTRHRKFCSLACARGTLGLTDVNATVEDECSQTSVNSLVSQSSQNSQDQNKPGLQLTNGKVKVENSELITNETVPLYLGPPTSESIPTFPFSTGKLNFGKLELPVDDPPPPVQNKKIKQELANSYSWYNELDDPNFNAVPVSCFKSAPMSDCWDNITVGMKVEVENRDCENYSDASFPDSFWVATVLKVAGYKALLRYEGFGQNNSCDFWVNLCSNDVHPVGWCATRGKPLIPPRSIEQNYKDWKKFLVKQLTGARTLPSNFYSKVHDSLKSRFRVGLNVEVIDKNRICQMRLATIKRIVGKRLYVEYYNAHPDDYGFWCHEDSPVIHPVGWSSRVGHLIDAPYEYMERCESGLIEKDDATEELFTAPFQTSVSTSRSPGLGKFSQGMKLEAIDPLNLGSICVATVMKVLRDDYLMIRIDSYPPDATDSDWFCYHSSSPCIFPPGFCQKNSITLVPPKDCDRDSFNWNTYVKKKSETLASVKLFEKKTSDHGFKVGMRLEAADLMDPRLVCVATVTRVVKHLLKIHFDGWEDEYDQWLDSQSPDIYPVGWCTVVSHKLEGPRCSQKPTSQALGKRRCKRRKAKSSSVSSKKMVVISKSAESECRENNEANSSQEAKSRLIFENDNLSQEDGSSLSIAMSSGTPEGNDNLTKEPETGGEPSGPDQSLPVSASPACSNASSDSTSSNLNSKSNSHSVKMLRATENGVEKASFTAPDWSKEDVAKFLSTNGCAAYSASFIEQGIDGEALLELTQDQIMSLVSFKIGPTLKVYHLIQQLKAKSKKFEGKKTFLR